MRVSSYDMSVRVLGEVHPFAFHAGITTVAPQEEFSGAVARGSECPRLAQEPDSPTTIYWSPDPGPELNSRGAEIIDKARRAFNKRGPDRP